MSWRLVREGYEGTLLDGKGIAVGRLHASIVSTATARRRLWPLPTYVAIVATDDFSPLLKWPESLIEIRVHARTYLLPSSYFKAEMLAQELVWWNGSWVSDQAQPLPRDAFDRSEMLRGEGVTLELFFLRDDVVGFQFEYGFDPVRHVYWRQGTAARHGAYDYAPETFIHPAATLEATYRGKIPPGIVRRLEMLPYARAGHRDAVLAALRALL